MTEEEVKPNKIAMSRHSSAIPLVHRRLQAGIFERRLMTATGTNDVNTPVRGRYGWRRR